MMTNEIAIAEQFVAQANPTGWNGQGKRPACFFTQPIVFYIPASPYTLQISYVFDDVDQQWIPFCELYDAETNLSLAET